MSPNVQTALQMLKDFFSRRSSAALFTLFQDFDVDNSGLLDLREFSAAIRQLNLHLSQEDMGALFRFFDKDGSGRLPPRAAYM